MMGNNYVYQEIICIVRLFKLPYMHYLFIDLKFNFCVVIKQQLLNKNQITNVYIIITNL